MFVGLFVFLYFSVLDDGLVVFKSFFVVKIFIYSKLERESTNRRGRGRGNLK